MLPDFFQEKSWCIRHGGRSHRWVCQDSPDRSHLLLRLQNQNCRFPSQQEPSRVFRFAPSASISMTSQKAISFFNSASSMEHIFPEVSSISATAAKPCSFNISETCSRSVLFTRGSMGSYAIWVVVEIITFYPKPVILHSDGKSDLSFHHHRLQRSLGIFYIKFLISPENNRIFFHPDLLHANYFHAMILLRLRNLKKQFYKKYIGFITFPKRKHVNKCNVTKQDLERVWQYTLTEQNLHHTSSNTSGLIRNGKAVLLLLFSGINIGDFHSNRNIVAFLYNPP